MKTFKMPTVERVIWVTLGGKDHLLVKAQGRGWFVDTRNLESRKAPSKRAVRACLTNPIESGFHPVKAKEYHL